MKKAWDVSTVLFISHEGFSSNSYIQIYIAAKEPREVALNAWLKLCRLDVNDEIEKWARVRKSNFNLAVYWELTVEVWLAPRFSADGRVALLRVDSGYQSNSPA